MVLIPVQGQETNVHKQAGSKKGELLLPLPLLFSSGPQGFGAAHPVGGGTTCFPMCTDSNTDVIQKHLTDTLK